MNSQVIIIVSLFIIYTSSQVPRERCFGIPGDGSSYDISPILSAGSDIIADVSTSVQKYTFFVELCGDSTRECDGCDRVGFCETWRNAVFKSCVGSFADVIGMPDGKGVEILYNGGENNKEGIVRINCVPSAGIKDKIRAETPADGAGTMYLVEFDSYAACPVEISYVTLVVMIFFACFNFIFYPWYDYK